MTKRNKIQWNRLIAKALEDAIKKAIELIAIAILLGAALKTIAVVIPAVAFGSVIARLVSTKIIP